MAPCKTKQPLEPSSTAAPAAVGRPNAKASRRPRARGSSRATTRLDAVVSGEEFSLQGIEDDDEISDTDPPNPSPELEVLKVQANTNAALDILHFFSGVKPTRGKSSSKEETPLSKICKLCSEKYGSDKSTLPSGIANFIYSPNTGNTNLRRHLYRVHAEEYDKAIEQHKWPVKLSTESRDASAQNARNQRSRDVPPFSPAAFLKHLVSFVVADDQSIRVVECPEFRQLCMVLCGTLVDADIPCRDKMREAIINQWRDSFGQLKLDLSKSCGRISFTSDAWSNANLESYLALTAHWVSRDESSGRLALKAALIGFHRLKTKHTGANIAKAILHLLDRAGVTLKIGYFTLDNAENNAVAMQELESLLAERETAVGFHFDHLKHRVRCYAHIINICSSHIISSVTSVSKRYLSDLKVAVDTDRMFRAEDDDDDDLDDDDDAGEDIAELQLDGCYDAHGDADLEEWFAGFKRDPLGRARRLIRLLRSSDQRKQRFHKFIEDGNERGWFTGINDKGKRVTIQVPNVQPLRDVKTRWDSVYMMVARLRELRPAIDRFFDTEFHDFSHWKLSGLDWYILEGLESVLGVPYSFQQSMSAESTPVLSRAISTFEMFMTEWEKVGKQHEKLRPWTEIGLRWAKKYYIRMDDTDAYVVTMFLNPSMRFSWIETEWERRYIREAKDIILKLMRRYRDRKSSTSEVAASDPPVPPPALPARVSGVRPAPTRFKVQDSVFNKKSTHGEFSVEAEFQRYTSGSSSPMTNILQFWEANKSEFPTLFSIAMDYLPIQATSVPSERVFSSAKDTDTAKRNRISSVLMEALQMLKHLLKKERLNFIKGWSTSVEAMSGAPEATGDLASLFVDDPDTALDALLKSLSNYD